MWSRLALHRRSSHLDRFTTSKTHRSRAYRPSVELLEARLPPGDAVFAGLLAHELVPSTERAAGLVPAVGAARPGPARPLADAAFLVGEQSFTLLPEPAERVMAPESLRPVSVIQKPFAQATADRHSPVTHLADTGAARVGTLSFGPLAVGSAHSVGGAVFVTPAVTNYQLDQAAATIALPVSETDDFDGGAEVQSSGVHALFDLSHPTNGPFPSNVFTVPDRTHNTGRRVNMPFPDCKVYVSDCEDLAVINELDGFNLQPRVSIPFDGPIVVNSVTSSTVFLVSLGSTVPGQGYMPRGTVVGINQIVWDVETNALHVKSDQLLAQHTRFALIVTNSIRDADGDPVGASQEFRRFRETVSGPYRRELEEAVLVARRLGVRERSIVTASVFTTQSATAVLEKIRDQIHAATPEPADFLLGEKGQRMVFDLDEIAGITHNQQRRTDTPELTSVNLTNLSLLRDIIPGAVDQVAFGKYVSPDYLVHPGEYMPPVGTRAGTPVVQGVNEIFFMLVLPSGPKPAGGWPVVLNGHGGGGNKETAAFLYAASMASQGLATLTINAPGHGYGPLSILTINPTSGDPVTFPGGGRGLDQDGDHLIGTQEGLFAASPRTISSFRDGLRQAAADLMQLVREIQVGVDVDGDGSPDLNAARISYYGQSTGSAYGTPFVAVEPGVPAAVLSTNSTTPTGRLTPGRSSFASIYLAPRVPTLLNSPGITEVDGVAIAGPHFDENLPLREGARFTVHLADGTSREVQSPVINIVAGAMALQEWYERFEWVQQAWSSAAYARHLRLAPLSGVPAKSVLLPFPKGDQTIMNPSESAVIRAGGLEDRTTFYRHDLAYADNPALPKNPHSFVSSISVGAFRPISLEAQRQVATFFASDGNEIIQPEPKRYFEVPIQGPLPEGLNFIP